MILISLLNFSDSSMILISNIHQNKKRIIELLFLPKISLIFKIIIETSPILINWVLHHL